MSCRHFYALLLLGSGKRSGGPPVPWGAVAESLRRVVSWYVASRVPPESYYVTLSPPLVRRAVYEYATEHKCKYAEMWKERLRDGTRTVMRVLMHETRCWARRCPEPRPEVLTVPRAWLLEYLRHFDGPCSRGPNSF
jgi:hypothetical protein